MIRTIHNYRSRFFVSILQRLLCTTLVVPMICLSAQALQAQDNAGAQASAVSSIGDDLLKPIWQGNVVYGESTVLLQEQAGSPLVGRLAFPVKKILSIHATNRSAAYPKSDNVKWNRENGTIELAADCGLPSILVGDLFLPPDSPGSYRHRTGHPEQWLRFGPGKWFHDRQVEVTYVHEPVQWKCDLPKLAAESLPKTIAKLRDGKPITLGVSGDSISTGLDASKTSDSTPQQPGYAELVVERLRRVYGHAPKLVNRAVGGWSVANGVQDADALMAEKPDVVIVAYGMNDVGRRDPAWFAKTTKELIDKLRKADPEVEIVLVSPMLGHNEWIHTPREMFALYRDELKKLCGPGIELADVSAVWQELLLHKHDLDLTGNGLNHPNDFGHRLYSQVISSLLVP